MRPAAVRLLIVLVPLALAGCYESNNKGKLESTRWRSDADSFKGQKLPAGFLKLHFKADGTLVFRAGPQEIKGTYSYGAGDLVTLNLDREVAGRKSHTERIIVRGDRMAISDSDGTEMRFQKE
jgi:hypothetical protein